MKKSLQSRIWIFIIIISFIYTSSGNCIGQNIGKKSIIPILEKEYKAKGINSAINLYRDLRQKIIIKKTITTMKTIKSIKKIILIISIFTVSTASAQKEFPNSASGLKAHKVLMLINSYDSIIAEKYITTNYTQDLLNAFPKAQHLSFFKHINSSFGELILNNIHYSSESIIDYQVFSSSTNAYLDVHLEVEESKPNNISNIGIRPGENMNNTSNDISSEKLDEEIKTIKKIIQNSLVDGYMNNYDVKEIKKGIHPEFIIRELQNNRLSQRGFDDLLNYVERVKPTRPNGRRTKVTIEFLSVDVVGNIGCAKVEFYDRSTLHGTDYITLMKFDDGWKIIAAIANQH